MVQRIGAIAGYRSWKVPVLRPSERRISIAYSMPARCQVWVRTTESQSAAGPQVCVLASLVLSAIHARVAHRTSVQPSEPPAEADEIVLTLPLVPMNERLTRPSRTFRGPAGGSWMSLQLFDHERAPLTEERELGVCVDGMREADLSLVARVHPTAWFSSRSGRETPEPLLRLDAELVFVSGIGLRMRMRPLVGAEDAKTLDVALANVGTTIHCADRVVERDLPGLPAIMLAFLDADGRAIGRERLAHVHV
jgi:hypothetical protein